MLGANQTEGDCGSIVIGGDSVVVVVVGTVVVLVVVVSTNEDDVEGADCTVVRLATDPGLQPLTRPMNSPVTTRRVMAPARLFVKTSRLAAPLPPL
jgi:hypothetical protein